MIKKNFLAFTIIELIIVIGIMAIISAVVLPNLAGYTKSEKENLANTRAKVVYMALQREVNKLAYSDSSFSPTYASGSYNGTTFDEKIGNSSTSKNIDLSYLISNELRKGKWIAKIDSDTKTVLYVHWVQDYTAPDTIFPSNVFINYSSLKTWNSSRNGGRIVGSYPVGT